MGIFSKGKPKKEEQKAKAGDSVVKENKTVVGIARLRTNKGIILRPHVSEKAMRGEPIGRYVFLVDKKAKKPEIKKEIQERFNVRVRSINTLIKKDKKSNWKGVRGKQKLVKKAIVTLKAGEKIEL
ncbi:MAG: 50S ribosomal protein L23 [Patescibacteria group bacterium]